MALIASVGTFSSFGQSPFTRGGELALVLSTITAYGRTAVLRGELVLCMLTRER